MNTNIKLKKANAYRITQEKLRNKALSKGVNLIAPETIFLSNDTAFGKNVIGSYIKLKNKEMKKYSSSMVKVLGFRGTKKNYKKNVITQWEKDNTLDC